MSAKQYRDAFENAVYKNYQAAEYAKVVKGNVENLRLISKQDFFTMNSNGTYKLDPINFAYDGWNEAITYILSTPIDESVSAVEHLIPNTFEE